MESELEFNLKDFVFNLLVFASTTMTDYLPLVFSYAMFNATGQSHMTAVCGLLYSLFVIFFGFCFDFFEPVNTLCRPYLVKKN